MNYNTSMNDKHVAINTITLMYTHHNITSNKIAVCARDERKGKDAYSLQIFDFKFCHAQYDCIFGNNSYSMLFFVWIKQITDIKWIDARKVNIRNSINQNGL